MVAAVEDLQRKLAALAPRERQLLVLMAVIVGLFLLGELVLLPCWHWRQRVHQEWQRSAALQQFFATHQTELVQASQWEMAAHQPLAQIIQSALVQTGLNAPSSMTQTGQQVQTEFKAVSFNALVSWLAQMQQHGIKIMLLDLLACKDQPGRVNASITLVGHAEGG